MKKAFTLSEILITLGIIGIVAALTLPALIHNYQKKALETQFKKNTSIILQAIQKAKYDLGFDEDFNKYCIENPLHQQTNGLESEYINASECINNLNNKFVVVSPNIQRKNNSVKTYNGSQTITPTSLAGIAHSIFQTKSITDGSFIGFNITEFKLYIVSDINGYKGPNKLGHDIFIFCLDAKDNLSSCGVPINLTEEEIESTDYIHDYLKQRAGNPCNLTSNQKGNGIGCSWYALKDICPYDNSKHYFECLPR